VEDRESACIWLEGELETLQEGPPEPAIDPISSSGDIVQVYLRPYLQNGWSPDSLLDAFMNWDFLSPD
jgi:hypothetical protein